MALGVETKFFNIKKIRMKIFTSVLIASHTTRTTNSLALQLNCIPLNNISMTFVRTNGDGGQWKICCIPLITVPKNASRSCLTVNMPPKITKWGKIISSLPVRPLDKSGRKINFCFNVKAIVSSTSLSAKFSRSFHSLNEVRRKNFFYCSKTLKID